MRDVFLKDPSAAMLNREQVTRLRAGKKSLDDNVDVSSDEGDNREH